MIADDKSPSPSSLLRRCQRLRVCLTRLMLVAGELLRAASKAVSDEATQKIFSETIQEIDEKSGHHYIEELWIEQVETSRIDSKHVWYKVTGSIDAELQYGSGSDFRKDDGATTVHNFPFTCELPAPANDSKKFDADLTTLKVEDGGWYD